MAMKRLYICFVMFAVVVIQTAYCCGPMATERQTSDQLEISIAPSSAASNEELVHIVKDFDVSNSGATVAKEKGEKPKNGLEETILLLNHQKEKQSDRVNHKLKKHHGKRHHRHHQSGNHRHHHKHHHHSAAAEVPWPNVSPAFPVYTQTVEPFEFEEYAQISPAPSVNIQLVSSPVYRYAGADRADDSQIKTASIDSLSSSPTSTVTTRNKLVTSALPNNQISTERGATSPDDLDPCTLWETCDLNQGVNGTRWLQELPRCPCQIQPLQLFYNNTIYDQALTTFFQWRIMAGDKQGILRRTAEFCIRSIPSTRVHAQVCCYDSKLKLITRGIGAGTPFLASPDWNKDAHYKMDTLPILICNGDWTRYHAVRPPNNGQNCTENPDDSEYALQVSKARDY